MRRVLWNSVNTELVLEKQNKELNQREDGGKLRHEDRSKTISHNMTNFKITDCRKTRSMAMIKLL